MDAAKQVYENILKISQNHPDALHLLGVAYHQQGNNEMAVNLIRKAIEIAPNSFLFYGNLGAAYHALKRYDEALSCYRKSLELNPNHRDAMLNMQKILKLQGQTPPDIKAELEQGITYQQSGNMTEAAECYRRILAYDPDHPDALQMLGVAEHFFGNEESSLKLLRRSIEINPKNPIYYSNVGNTLRELGQLEDALAAYRKCAEMNPRIAEVYVNMGLIYYDLGKSEEAISS
ncbi:MAG: tetratricopeptide repeat protein [Desulfobacteraceae bacterium]|nr:tetratricopeptide repeat protein [Desulfobacteraceae bacterium]